MLLKLLDIFLIGISLHSDQPDKPLLQPKSSLGRSLVWCVSSKPMFFIKICSVRFCSCKQLGICYCGSFSIALSFLLQNSSQSKYNVAVDYYFVSQISHCQFWDCIFYNARHFYYFFIFSDVYYMKYVFPINVFYSFIKLLSLLPSNYKIFNHWHDIILNPGII